MKIKNAGLLTQAIQLGREIVALIKAKREAAKAEAAKIKEEQDAYYER